MSLKKKAMQTKSTTILKTVRELKKEKKSYFLLGQKHDPPEDVRATIFQFLTFPLISFNDKLLSNEL